MPSCGSWPIRKTSAQSACLELAIRRPVIEASDQLVDLLQEDAALQHAGGLRGEHEVAADHRADRLVGDATGGLVNDLELRAKHAGFASLVDRAQSSLPEAPTGRKQWIVGDEHRLVRGLRLEARSAKVLVDFTAVLVQSRL